MAALEPMMIAVRRDIPQAAALSFLAPGEGTLESSCGSMVVM
jgi:hypothetical protein